MEEKKTNKPDTTENRDITIGGDGTKKSEASDSIISEVQLIRTQMLKHSTHIAGFFKAVAKRLIARLDKLEKTVDRLDQGFFECVNTAKSCQEQTAKFLNNELERHALNPAIKVVVVLADELYRLKDAFNQLQSDYKFNTLSQYLEMSRQLADDQLSYLDITRINPSAGQDYDHNAHEICSYTNSPDRGMHGKISSVITPGIIYRGKVLRPARVSVFRHNKTNKI